MAGISRPNPLWSLLVIVVGAAVSVAGGAGVAVGAAPLHLDATARSSTSSHTRLMVSPRPAMPGERVVVSGRVPSGHHRRRVVLERKSGNHWRRIGSRRTHRDGTFVFTVRAGSRAGASARMRVTAPRSGAGRRVRTPHRTIRTVAQSGHLVAPTQVAAGGRFTLTATFSPARPGRSVVLQRQVNGAWQSISSGRENRGGTYAVGRTADDQGAQQFRAVTPAYHGAAASSTASVVVQVSAPPATCPSTASTVPAGECAALVAIYKANGGANWPFQANWMTTADPCTWYGVLCSDGRVTQLNPAFDVLTGALPVEIGGLTKLTSLNLSGSHLVSLPATIGDLTDLTILNLDANHIAALPDTIGGLANLSVLSMESNELVTLPTTIGELAHLTLLDLNYNHLGALPTTIGALADLTKLTLTANELTGLPASITGLTQLTTLALANNQLTTLPADIGDLAHLADLSLVHNLLSGDITSWAAGLFAADPGIALSLHDGSSGTDVWNNCLKVGPDQSALAGWLYSRDDQWDECKV